jgi:hypothetical protein
MLASPQCDITLLAHGMAWHAAHVILSPDRYSCILGLLISSVAIEVRIKAKAPSSAIPSGLLLLCESVFGTASIISIEDAMNEVTSLAWPWRCCNCTVWHARASWEQQQRGNPVGGGRPGAVAQE